MSDSISAALVTGATTLLGIALSRWMSHREHRKGQAVSVENKETMARIESQLNGELEKKIRQVVKDSLS